MRSSETAFFNTLSEGIDKKALLSEESASALEVHDPALLEQLEMYASNRPKKDDQPQEVDPEVEEELPPEKVKLDIQASRNVLKGSTTHPLLIAALMKTKYGDSWASWLPETLWETLRRDIGPVSEVSQNKIQALAVSLATNFTWSDWTTFENCGRAFNNTIPIFGQLQPLSPGEAAFTVSVLDALTEEELSSEVLGYIASVCMYNGIVYAPEDMFGKVQPFIDAQSKDTAIRDEVKKAWASLGKQDISQVDLIDDRPLDVQVTKLWSVREYLSMMSSRLGNA